VRNTVIYTLRHGETRYTVERRYAGTIDVPLSPAGRKAARLFAAKLAHIRYDVIVSSPLKRAMQTAHYFRRSGVGIVATRLCAERNFGAIEGLTWDQVQQLDPPILLVKVGRDLHTVNPKGAEPFEDLWARAKAFREFLLQNFVGSRILVLSHGVFLQLFHGLLRGLTCIESLVNYPGPLELRQFTMRGNKLKAERLVEAEPLAPVRW
jgi:broad specificity phosphatase PhoE